MYTTYNPIQAKPCGLVLCRRYLNLIKKKNLAPVVAVGQKHAFLMRRNRHEIDNSLRVLNIKAN